MKTCFVVGIYVVENILGLQPFGFSVVIVNDEHRKIGFKIKCRG